MMMDITFVLSFLMIGMIICFEGTPGSGKSYEAVKKILDNLKLGRTVYTNIDGLDDTVNREAIKIYTGLDDYELGTRLLFLAGHEIHEFWKKCKPGSLIVLDEVHKWFNSRDWQKQSNREFSNWASTHRHHGYEVILITQNLERVDAAVRQLVEYTYRFRKLNMFGFFLRNQYKCDAFMGDDTGAKSIKTEMRTYNKDIFRCYKSYITADVKEIGIMKHANVLKHPVFIILPFVLAFSLYMFFFKSSFASGDLFGTKKVLNKTKSSKSLSGASPIIPIIQPGSALVQAGPSFPTVVEGPKISDIQKIAYNDIKYVDRECDLEGTLKIDSDGKTIEKKIYSCADGKKKVFFKGNILEKIKTVKVVSNENFSLSPFLQADSKIK